MGRGGGLALFWMKKADVEVLSFSKYHIDVSVGVENEGRVSRFIGFYGEPDKSKRHESWKILHRLKDSNKFTMIMCRGF